MSTVTQQRDALQQENRKQDRREWVVIVFLVVIVLVVCCSCSCSCCSFFLNRPTGLLLDPQLTPQWFMGFTTSNLLDGGGKKPTFKEAGGRKKLPAVEEKNL